MISLLFDFLMPPAFKAPRKRTGKWFPTLRPVLVNHTLWLRLLCLVFCFFDLAYVLSISSSKGISKYSSLYRFSFSRTPLTSYPDQSTSAFLSSIPQGTGLALLGKTILPRGSVANTRAPTINTQNTPYYSTSTGFSTPAFTRRYAFRLSNTQYAQSQSPLQGIAFKLGNEVQELNENEMSSKVRCGGVLIDLQLDGGKPHTFVLDTGSSFSIIRKSLANALGLKVLQEANSDGATRRYATAGSPSRIKPSEMALLQMIVENCPIEVPAVILEDIDIHLPHKISGILGLNFLRRFQVVDFDFKNGIIYFYANKEAGHFNISGLHSIPFEENTSPGSGLLTVPLVLERSDTNQQSPKFKLCDGIIDLGSTHSIAPSSFARFLSTRQSSMPSQIGWSVDGTAFPLQMYPIASLFVADFPERLLPLCTHECLLAVGTLRGLEETMASSSLLLGLDILGKHRLAIDFKNKSLYVDIPNPPALNAFTATQQADFIEAKMAVLKEKLTRGEIKFSQLQHLLQSANISSHHCKTTEALLHLVAKLSILGPTSCQEDLNASSALPSFMEKTSQVEQKLTELQKEYQTLEPSKKKTFLNRILSKLQKSEAYQEIRKVSEILKEYAQFLVYGTKEQFGTPEASQTHPVEDTRGNVASYINETKHLQEELKNCNPWTKEMLIQTYKKELEEKKVDFSDCKTDRELANRLAFARIFSSSDGTSQTAPKNDQQNFFSSRRQKGTNFSKKKISSLKDSSSLSPFASFLDSPFDKIFEEFFGDSFPFGSSMRQSFFGDSSGNSFIIRLGGDLDNTIELDGNNNGFKRQRKGGNEKQTLDFKSETHKDKKNSSNTSSHVESDPFLIQLLEKSKQLDDSNAIIFVQHAVQDAVTRPLLLNACKNGLIKAMEEAKRNKNTKALYVLQRMKELGLF